MFPLGLSAEERRLFTHALSASVDPYVAPPDPGEDPGEGDDEPKVGDTPTTPGTDPGGNPMRFVSANIRHGMTVPNKRADFELVKTLGSIICWQEVGGVESSRTLLENIFPASDWFHTPPINNIGTRISVKKSLWSVEASATYQMHGRNPAITSGARETYVTLALVTLKTTSIQFLVTDSHYVPHAWCAHNVPAKQWRKDKWNLHHNKWQSIVMDARGKGITVIGGADFNNPTPSLFNAAQVWFRSAKIDRLFGLQATGGATFVKNSDQSVNMNSDHNALVAQLTWTAGTNSLKTGYHWPRL